MKCFIWYDQTRGYESLFKYITPLQDKIHNDNNDNNLKLYPGMIIIRALFSNQN